MPGLLLFSPHPDDAEFVLGGTILKHCSLYPVEIAGSTKFSEEAGLPYNCKYIVSYRFPGKTRLTFEMRSLRGHAFSIENDFDEHHPALAVPSVEEMLKDEYPRLSKALESLSEIERES